MKILIILMLLLSMGAVFAKKPNNEDQVYLLKEASFGFSVNKKGKIKCDESCWVTVINRQTVNNGEYYVVDYYVCKDADGTQTCLDERKSSGMFVIISDLGSESLGKKVMGIDN